jgi:hypothetical protein
MSFVFLSCGDKARHVQFSGGGGQIFPTAPTSVLRECACAIYGIYNFDVFLEYGNASNEFAAKTLEAEDEVRDRLNHDRIYFPGRDVFRQCRRKRSPSRHQRFRSEWRQFPADLAGGKGCDGPLWE